MERNASDVYWVRIQQERDRDIDIDISRTVFLRNAIQRINNSRELLSKGQTIDGVGEVELHVLERLQIVDMHMMLLETLSWGKVEITGHLFV